MKRTLMAGGPGGIPVEVERKRVRRLNLRVRSDGSAHLSIPLHTTFEYAQRFLDDHESWLRKKIFAASNALHNPRTGSFRSGERSWAYQRELQPTSSTAGSWQSAYPM